ncbi:conserved hypothetical protein [Coccidioides posadasii str. Silveira]|uniref:Uncharacterized protein n=2 Tax=Coccidioides posadasii TaxID=199306 RepID=E9DG54_COCPS|nr:conserved hypothetical protein [Coccidioides posadasii str. Silveira]KMM68321.1 hypothetical protein CPAG_04650 [Coccidioides posadasii RMSCC 3488]
MMELPDNRGICIRGRSQQDDRNVLGSNSQCGSLPDTDPYPQGSMLAENFNFLCFGPAQNQGKPLIERRKPGGPKSP